jgi:hypothetical protein
LLQNVDLPQIGRRINLQFASHISYQFDMSGEKTMRHNIVSSCVITAFLAACGGQVTDGILSPSSTSTKTAPYAQFVTDYNTIVQQLYVAYFGRPADPTGLANFTAALNRVDAPIDIQALNNAYSSNPAIRALVDSFGTSAESESLYAGDTVAFVTAIYRNVLNRAPDRAGLDFWTSAIDQRGLTRANASFSIMAGALANQTPQGQIDARLINQRITAAATFTNALSTPELVSAYSGNRAAAVARYMLSLVNENSDAAAIQETVRSTVPLLTSSAPVPAPAPVPSPESASGTTILPGSGAVIIDFRGYSWGLTADGKIIINGVVDQSTEKVERLIYQNNIQGRTVWQQANSQRYWWQWDYSSQAWIFMGTNGYTAPVPSPNFSAALSIAPGDNSTLSQTVRLEVRGQGLSNVELLPATGYSPLYGRFVISPDRSTATLEFNTSGLTDGTYQFRISAFDSPAGVTATREIIAMPTRTWRIQNPGTSFPTPLPGLFSGEVTPCDTRIRQIIGQRGLPTRNQRTSSSNGAHLFYSYPSQAYSVSFFWGTAWTGNTTSCDVIENFSSL